MKKVSLYRPLIEEEELHSVCESLKQGWLGLGKDVAKFEAAVQKTIESPDRHVVALSTGHAALHLGLMIAGVKPGDEVITPSFNNIADFQAILAVGAKPVFCDIYDDTLCIDLDKAEELITDKTRVIIVMDYFCHTCDYDKAAELAKKYNLRIIHDAAHSFGSFYKSKPIGSFSDICMFSFDPIKSVTSIEGGALVVKTKEEAENLYQMRIIGMTQKVETLYQNQRSYQYDVVQLGYRYHMANSHGAVGLSQINKLETIRSTRQAACAYFNENLKDLPGLRLPDTDFKDVVPFLYYVRVLNGQRSKFREYLESHGVETGFHWVPGHSFTLFKDVKRGDLSVTDQICEELVSLPLYTNIDRSDQDIIIKAIRDFFNEG